MAQYFDVHIHLQDERFGDNWLTHWNDANRNSVSGALCCGSEPCDWPKVREIAATVRGIVPAYGVHPWYIHRIGNNWLDDLEMRLQAGGCGLGEVGLDGRFAKTPMLRQMDVLEAQLRLADRFRLPVSLHTLDAWDQMIEILQAFHGLRFNLHAFSAPERIDRLAHLGAFFSFNGGLSRKGNTRMKKALCACPPERLLLETDAPDFPLLEPGIYDKDKINLPKNLPEINRLAANLLGLESAQLADTVWNNSETYMGELFPYGPV